MSEIDRIRALKAKVKHGKLKIEKKDIKSQLLKDFKHTDSEREEICKKARKEAHKPIANMRRDMSNEIRSGLGNTLSEGYDFIEESFGSGMPEFTFYEEPQISESISESFSDGNKYKMIGVAEGVFAPIGVMSRNNRMYDNDHYDYLLENQILVDKIANRGMLGTIGHHDKRVDDEDLALGNVSHIVTDLHIQEEEDGTRNLVGRLEIMDTPAGNLLKTYYDHGVPLYVSSRGAGRLLPVANESYKRVDKTNYYLETFDVVKDPGFLGAKPKYVTESLDENNIDGDVNMAKDLTKPEISTEMETEEIVTKMLNPLKEQLAELADAVKALTDKALNEEEAKEEVSEECEACAEPKKETEDDEKEEKAPVAEAVEETEEVVEEAKAEEAPVVEAKEDEAEDAKEDEAKAEELKADAEEDKEDAEEIKEEVEVSEEKKEEEADKLEADAEDDEAKAEKLEKDAKEDEKVEEAKEEAEPAEDEAKIEESASEAVEETEEVVEEAKAEEEVSEEIVEEAEEKEEVSEDKIEEGCDDCDKEEKEEKAEHQAEKAVEKAVEDEKAEEKCEEEIEEAIDYKAEYEKNEAVAKDLLKIVEEATTKSKAVLEKYNAISKELDAYKLSEEFSITVDEAKAKLEEATVEAIREELAKAEETPVEKEPEDAEEEKKVAPVIEAKKPAKGVFTRFASLSESKSGKNVFSVFKNL